LTSVHYDVPEHGAWQIHEAAVPSRLQSHLALF
jgi:hypothetical protein